jgi:hypothetical protein
MSLELAIKQLEFARSYLLSLLADIPPEEWFVMPPGCGTHVAWQVGHLAMAEYGLCLFRQRGRSEVDLSLMTSSFRKAFSRGTTPEPDPAKNPSPEELRNILDKVHAQVLIELSSLTPEQLAEPVDMPYAAYPNKLGCLLFASHHEMIHAGQLGLLRRLLGKSPVR